MQSEEVSRQASQACQEIPCSVHNCNCRCVEKKLKWKCARECALDRVHWAAAVLYLQGLPLRSGPNTHGWGLIVQTCSCSCCATAGLALLLL